MPYCAGVDHDCSTLDWILEHVDQCVAGWVCHWLGQPRHGGTGDGRRPTEGDEVRLGSSAQFPLLEVKSFVSIEAATDTKG